MLLPIINDQLLFEFKRKSFLGDYLATICLIQVKLCPEKVYLPILVEKDEDGFYVVKCPLLQGCYLQGKTLEGALRNMHEVIEICLDRYDKPQ